MLFYRPSVMDLQLLTMRILIIRRKVINLSSNFNDSKNVFAKIYILWVIIYNKIVGFFVIFLLREIFYSKTARIGVDMALCLLIANVTPCIILAKLCSM